MLTVIRMVHVKCRNSIYPGSDIPRYILQDCEVPWSYGLGNYDPPEYNSKAIFNKPWSDPPIGDSGFKPKWNDIDGNINRKSYSSSYDVKNGRPLNPEGRTGIQGRGLLGRWGPNHAADPIVTRWKRLNDETTKLPILQFCAIQRKDNGQWALPGGMVDPGEKVSITLQREFMEEALNSLGTTEEQRKKDAEKIEKFFKNGTDIYKGYVDDPRNTDNAWMETVAVNFHDETGETLGKLDLNAGDDAKNVQWMDLSKTLDLYASHSKFIEIVAKLNKAHW